MILNSISDQELFEKTRLLSLEERRITTEILHLLREISRRRLYAKRGYESLFTFLVQELGYDEASAYRRVSAIRVIEALPEVERSLEQGKLTVATVAQAQTFFQQEKKRSTPCSVEKKREILKKLEGKSKREAERILAKEAPEVPKPDQTRAVGESSAEIRFTADRELLGMLEQLHALTAHHGIESGYNGLFKFVAAQVLKKLDPATRVIAEKRVGSGKQSGPAKQLASATKPVAVKQSDEVEYRERKSLAPEKVGGVSASKLDAAGSDTADSGITYPGMTEGTASELGALETRSRYIPVRLKREIWKKSQGRCEYVSLVTGIRCESKHGLQFDHVMPFAMGGKTCVSNLRLLCANHNQLAAIEVYGERKMGRYLR